MRPRLAWFTPLPPTRSAVATCNAELLPLLADAFEIDVFVENQRLWPSAQRPAPNAQRPASALNAPARLAEVRFPRAGSERRPPTSGARVLDAHDFVWRHARAPYDLVVYQLGNRSCHDYMWAYLTRYPGLVVLHDTQLHESRAQALLRHERRDHYRVEFAWNHPSTPPDVADLVIDGLLEPLGYLWPMVRLAIMTARHVAVHSPWLAESLGEDHPQARIDTIRMGVADPLRGVQTSAGDAIRALHGIPQDAVLFAAFGGGTSETRIPQILASLPAVAARVPEMHLLIVDGDPNTPVEAELATSEEKSWAATGAGASGGHPQAGRPRDATGTAREDTRDRVTFAGYVPDDELPAYLAAADVWLCLRWPPSRELSAWWLQCLAAGKPTIVTDLAHTTDVPALVTRGSWTPSHPARAPAPEEDELAPVCVSVDILDEEQSLPLAMSRLAEDSAMRRTLGQRARRYWERRHTPAVMAEDYRRVIAAALEQPARRADSPSSGFQGLPVHFHTDVSAPARRLAAELGIMPDILEDPVSKA